jgi:hypothetical protein
VTTYLLCLMALFCQQTVGIPMDTTCAPPLLADLFLYCYLDIKQGLLKKKRKDLRPILEFHAPLYR